MEYRWAWEKDTLNITLPGNSNTGAPKCGTKPETIPAESDAIVMNSSV